MVADSGKSKKLILVRHAQTVWNQEGRFQGHLDSRVTDEGKAQIDAVARRLQNDDIDVVYTSDLGRSILTADRIARLAHAPVVVDVRLRERNHGLFEGLTKEITQRRYPELVEQWRTNDDGYFAIANAESKQQLLDRILPLMLEAAQRPGDGSVVVIGHGGMLNVFFNHVENRPVAHRNGRVVRNCSVSVMEYACGRWNVESLGDTTHLPVLA